MLEEMLVEEVMRRKNGLDDAHMNEQVLKRDLGGTSVEKKDQSGPQLPISFQLLGSLSRRCGTCTEKGENISLRRSRKWRYFGM